MDSTIGAEASGESPIVDGASLVGSTIGTECSDEIAMVKGASLMGFTIGAESCFSLVPSNT
jgi:hypothetical protein